MTHQIELRRVKPPFEKGDYFDRGERAIFVDGVRWGRTIVTFHGCHGTTHTFVQDKGHTIEERPGERYPGEVSVRSQKRRKWLDSNDWRPTEEKVMEKITELINTGRLRHPNIVKTENEQAMEEYRARARKAEEKQQAKLRERACKALGINQDDGSEIIDRVVEAMKWAQTQ